MPFLLRCRDFRGRGRSRSLAANALRARSRYGPQGRRVKSRWRSDIRDRLHVFPDALPGMIVRIPAGASDSKFYVISAADSVRESDETALVPIQPSGASTIAAPAAAVASR